MQKVLYAGTFDPPTLGHLEIIKRASKLYDYLIVGVGQNPSKGSPLLTQEQRIEILKKETKDLQNVDVIQFSGLVTTFAHTNGIGCLIRGIRTTEDLNKEIQMASANRLLTGIETVLLPADPKFVAISSTLIRELAELGAPVNAFIPESAVKTLQHQKEK